MFGYVRILKSELRVWEYETYHAVYCSLCKQLGKTYGPFARLTLSYDFTFLALLSLSLQNGEVPQKSGRCTCNPLKKCSYCTDCDGVLENASAAAMVMLYYKLLDNIDDSEMPKKLFYKLLSPYFSRKHKKAVAKYPQFGEIVGEYIERQNLLEKNGCTVLDEIAEPTAVALGKIFELLTDDASQKRVLSQLGYCIGKWIYLIDCAADLEKDIKDGSFNPLKIGATEPLKEYAKARLEPLLNTCITNAGLSLELLDVKKYRGILENIVYLGMKSTQNTVFSKGDTK